MSAFVRLEKDSEQPEWEVGCVTYPLDGKILKTQSSNDLWKMNSTKRTEKLSKAGALLT
jgi:hypothetical protein